MSKKLNFLGFQLEVRRQPKATIESNKLNTQNLKDIKLNFGPGPNWKKPSAQWYTVDVDPNLGDVVVDFQKFEALPFSDESVDCIYGSHVFEHMSIYKTPLIFKEIHRVLKKGGVVRLILPDAEKSIHAYVNKDYDYLLFKRRRERGLRSYNIEYTLFECLKEDFLSRTSQSGLLGNISLAHQNAWDYETIKKDLWLAGFTNENISKMDFQKSHTNAFDFEGTYPSEANEDYRSLYVEAIK